MFARREPQVTCVYKFDTPKFKVEIKKGQEEPYCEEGANAAGDKGFKFKNIPIFCTCTGTFDKQRGVCPNSVKPCPDRLEESHQLATAPVVPPIGNPGEYFVFGTTEESEAKCEAAAAQYVSKLICGAQTWVQKGNELQMMGNICSVQQKRDCKQDVKEAPVSCVPDPEDPNKQICCSGTLDNPTHCEEKLS
jgi:hypothetical protein